LGRAFDFFAALPFILLGRIGFDRRKAERSIVGRIIKGILYLIEVFAAVLTTLHFLGYLEKFKAILAKILT
jgi:TM2 domain-containing membrane protein YozV